MITTRPLVRADEKLTAFLELEAAIALGCQIQNASQGRARIVFDWWMINGLRSVCHQ
jgi:hypothetical protein